MNQGITVSEVKRLLKRTNQLKAELQLLRFSQDTHRSNEVIILLEHVSAWLALLTDDEAYVVERHLIDGIDIPRIAYEFQRKWGDYLAKSERTIKTYQHRALTKIVNFENAKDCETNKYWHQ